eukprot:246603-Pyramimonas_sp.AAC.1
MGGRDVALERRLGNNDNQRLRLCHIFLDPPKCGSRSGGVRAKVMSAGRASTRAPRAFYSFSPDVSASRG